MENEKSFDKLAEQIKSILNGYRLRSVQIDIDNNTQNVEVLITRKGFNPQTIKFNSLEKGIDFIMRTSQGIDSIEHDIDFFIREAKNEIN